MADLFDMPSPQPDGGPRPLADRLRPRSLSEVIGQDKVLSRDGPLGAMLAAGSLSSLVLWGPPGVGKTTIARLLADETDLQFVQISAIFTGVPDLRKVFEAARLRRQNVRDGKTRGTLLFVDEIHRFNKAQQDGFLPFVESGLFTFIGATTENPSFEVNSALLSRASVYVLKSLDEGEMGQLFDRARDKALADLSFDDDARTRLIGLADGDARRLLNLLEQVRTAAHAARQATVDGAFIEATMAQNLRRFDKGGDAFYDQISALHKSVRGSSPDVALYWFCRMLDGGADPRYLARRIIRMAWEDIGLADPRAMQIANDAAETFERLGSPEGELALAQAVTYLAVAAKSNAGYNAYNAARAFVKQDGSRPVPVHLRNAPTKLMKELGYGKEYRYAHDEPEAYAAGETYLPDGMPEPHWYDPTPRGLEGKIGEKLAHLRELDRKAGKK